MIDQHHAGGSFDEPKALMGSDSLDDARQTYRTHYPASWKGDRAITAMPLTHSKEWLEHGDLTQPAVP